MKKSRRFLCVSVLALLGLQVAVLAFSLNGSATISCTVNTTTNIRLVVTVFLGIVGLVLMRPAL